MRKIFFLALLSFTLHTTTEASARMWLRESAVSPDGKSIAFVWRGDIYIVPSTGGEARQLTTDAAYETAPVWSPDGRRIAFSSDRFGGFDVFVTDVEGGTPKRLTTHSANELVKAYLPDGRILYRTYYRPTAEDGSFPGTFCQIYSTDTTGSRPQRFSETDMSDLSVNARGEVLYQDNKGYEDQWRKHHVSPITRDIWLTGSDPAHRSFRKLSDFAGECRNPRWAPDGKSYYYLEESSGTMNVYRRNLDGSGKRQLTDFKRNPVRYLSVSPSGLMSFSYNGDLYTMRDGEEPKKLSITIRADHSEPPVRAINFSGGADNGVSVSSDGKQIAFTANSQVFVTGPDYATTKSITDSPERKENVSISPDGRKIVYDCEKNGVWGIYMTTMPRKEDDNFVYARELKEEPLIVGKESCYQPRFSPDGKKISYWANRSELRVFDLASRTSRTVLSGRLNYAYTDFSLDADWSPDSKYLLAPYMGEGGWNNRDVALVWADGSKYVNLTESGYSDGQAHWALGGKAVAFTSDRQGYRSHGSWGAEDDIFIMYLDKEAYDRAHMSKEDRERYDAAKKKAEEEAGKKDGDKKDNAKDAGKSDKKGSKGDKKDKKKSDNKDKKQKDNKKDDAKGAEKPDDTKAASDSTKGLKLMLEGREDRIDRLTTASSNIGDFFISPDGRKVYYSASFGGGMDLRVRDLDDGSERVLTGGVGGGFTPSADGKAIYLGGGNIRKISLDNGQTKQIPFSATIHYSATKERENIFEHVVKTMQDRFYRTDMNGCDWQYYADNYRKFLPDIANDYDMAEMLGEMLGELNASHTGARYGGTGAPQQTAALGAFYDESYKGDGLKIKEIIAQGPLDFIGSDIKAGDVITKIDGKEIKKGEDYFPLLAGLAGKHVLLTLKHDGKGKEYEADVQPYNTGAETSQLYTRWVKHREELVDKYSGGKVGYVHVKSMDSQSFREVYSRVLGKLRNKQALVVDIRNNGGGWLHNDLGIFLSGRLFATYEPRGNYIGSDPYMRWYKPSCVVISQNDYSNAHGFPFVYKELGIGKLVGAPMAGTMTAVWWERQQGGRIIVGYPEVAVKDNKGQYLENQTLEPDVTSIPTPEQMLSDDDVQIKKAVDTLLGK